MKISTRRPSGMSDREWAQHVRIMIDYYQRIGATFNDASARRAAWEAEL